jgi:Fe-S cluster biogenesis protein NfuA
MNTLEVNVRAEYTPNPNSLKFICNDTLYPYTASLTYNSRVEAGAACNEMAVKLFDVEGIVRVFIMSNFVTVDKRDETNWKDIHLQIKDIMKLNLKNFKEWAENNKPPNYNPNPNEDTKRERIENVLNKIRPALVADGGNIELVDIIGTDVRLRMVGACGTCPSALMTMKMGVERALTAELPDIVETVTQVY